MGVRSGLVKNQITLGHAINYLGQMRKKLFGALWGRVQLLPKCVMPYPVAG